MNDQNRLRSRLVKLEEMVVVLATLRLSSYCFIYFLPNGSGSFPVVRDNWQCKSQIEAKLTIFIFTSYQNYI
ncbi:hypothetical protein T07_2620 [Trichinella nelsoni]|uniref:Uncharacterized protein n=1 Tax=Trichinella nelsoni TaxID=6336 RepID=A0A0V0SHG2_9BILA|nr:hypothetical protein T07_2620 [Trichinella nelsoni]